MITIIVGSPGLTTISHLYPDFENANRDHYRDQKPLPEKSLIDLHLTTGSRLDCRAISHQHMNRGKYDSDQDLFTHLVQLVRTRMRELPGIFAGSL
ncbi:MAG: hypothetical protein LUQ35_08895 [Methanoregula sp.]|jgi:hypothetical protein|nr:hypothetical protein [Methanoregula sp.]